MKEILNTIHKTIYQFFDASEDDAPMSDKDKLLLEVNKAICNNLKALEQEHRWIPVKWHEITEEEREKEGYSSEWLVHLDCILPEDGEEILITTKHGYVEKDTAYYDDGYYLDSGYDWVDDVVAWMPLPEPYKAESEDKLDGNPVDIDKAVEHYEGTLEVLKGIDLEVDA